MVFENASNLQWNIHVTELQRLSENINFIEQPHSKIFIDDNCIRFFQCSDLISQDQWEIENLQKMFVCNIYIFLKGHRVLRINQVSPTRSHDTGCIFYTGNCFL